MTHIEIIIMGLALSFCWSIINPWYNTKPFNCLMCMTGYFSVSVALFSVGWYCVLFFPVGCLAGAVFTSLRDRYL